MWERRVNKWIKEKKKKSPMFLFVKENKRRWGEEKVVKEPTEVTKFIDISENALQQKRLRSLQSQYLVPYKVLKKGCRQEK